MWDKKQKATNGQRKQQLKKFRDTNRMVVTRRGVVCRENEGGTGVRYVVMEGDEAPGGEHTTVYRCCIIKLHT